MKTVGTAIFSALLLVVASVAGAVTGRYRLTWREDPTTTMVVGWSQTGVGDPVVCYGSEDLGNDWERYPVHKAADRSTTYGGMDNRFARLTDLLPDTPYFFVIKIGDDVSERYWFRTALNQSKPFTFIAGGDSRSNRAPRQMANRMVGKLRPLFVAFGADFTESGTATQWQDWLDDWQLSTTSDGRLIPILVCRGTHETTNSVVEGLFDPASADLYYALGIGGSLFRMCTLNTEMAAAGAQQAWLEGDLQNHGVTRFKVVQYHKSFRSHNLGKSEGDDEYAAWAQAFFDHGLALAFESHSHCAKITWPLRPDSGPGSDEGFIRDDLAGTVFAGEGGWGAPLREAIDNKEWALDSGSSRLVANRSPGLAAWTRYHFGEDAGASDLADPGEDPDGDGLPNVVEYASLLDPLVADGNDQAAAMAGVGIEFVYREAWQHPGVGLVVEWSTDLSSWYGSGEGPSPKIFATTPIEDRPANDWVRQRAVIPAGDDVRIFLRLRAKAL